MTETVASSPLRHPSAWIPLILSSAALAIVLIHFTRYGKIGRASCRERVYSSV